MEQGHEKQAQSKDVINAVIILLALTSGCTKLVARR